METGLGDIPRKFRNAITLRILVILLPAVMQLSCFAQDEPSGRIDLSGEWKLTRTVNSRDGTTVTREERVHLPGSWTSLLKDNDDLAAVVTLKKEFAVGEGFQGKFLTLSLGRIAVADETFFNGVRIGVTGGFPGEGKGLDYGFAWLRERRYAIPEHLVAFGRPNEIRIRVFSHVVNGVSGSLYIGDLSRDAGFHVRPWGLLDLDAKTMAINIILGVFVIIILVAYGKWLAIVYTALIIAIVTAVQFTLTGAGFEDGLTRFRVILSLFSLGYLFFTLAVEEFFEKSFKYSKPVLLIAVAVAEAAVFAAPDSRSLICFTGALTVSLNIVMIAYYTAMYLLALRENFRRYWIFLLVSVPLIVTTAQTYRHFFSMEFQKMPSVFLFHLPMVLIGILLVLLVDFINVHTEMGLIKDVLAFKDRAIRRIMKRTKEGAGDEPREKLRDLLSHLDGNFNEKYNRAELAGRFKLNEDYMCQIFKKKTGMSISNYINRKRVEASKDLLVKTDSKIIDIAYHVGFESLVHFHREFKKYAGMTPMAYRLNRGPDAVLNS